MFFTFHSQRISLEEQKERKKEILNLKVIIEGSVICFYFLLLLFVLDELFVIDVLTNSSMMLFNTVCVCVIFIGICFVIFFNEGEFARMFSTLHGFVASLTSLLLHYTSTQLLLLTTLHFFSLHFCYTSLLLHFTSTFYYTSLLLDFSSLHFYCTSTSYYTTLLLHFYYTSTFYYTSILLHFYFTTLLLHYTTLLLHFYFLLHFTAT